MCKDYPSCDIAYNAVIPLSRAPTCGRYSRIVGVTLTDASRDHLDSCVGCVFRERTVDRAELLLNNMLTNENNWTLPEQTPKPTPKKRGILFLSPEDMQEGNKL